MAFEITVRQEEDSEPASVYLLVESDGVKLLGLQQALCRAFKKPFPATMVNLSVTYRIVSNFPLVRRIV